MPNQRRSRDGRPHITINNPIGPVALGKSTATGDVAAGAARVDKRRVALTAAGLIAALGLAFFYAARADQRHHAVTTPPTAVTTVAPSVVAATTPPAVVAPVVSPATAVTAVPVAATTPDVNVRPAASTRAQPRTATRTALHRSSLAARGGSGPTQIGYDHARQVQVNGGEGTIVNMGAP